MSKRSKEDKNKTSVFESARNELLSQIKHCGVLEATDDQRDKWFKDTMDYLIKRYPGIGQEQLTELEQLGRRYCRPVIAYGSGNDATNRDQD